MTDYKRFTMKFKPGVYHLLCLDCPIGRHKCKIDDCKFAVTSRLGELEDKIESGEFVLKKEIVKDFAERVKFETTVENLEWCTPLENVEHASKTIKTMTQYKKANNRRKRKVKMLDRFSGYEIATFESINEAARRTNIPLSNIVACLKGRQAYTKEFTWQYVEEVKV